MTVMNTSASNSAVKETSPDATPAPIMMNTVEVYVESGKRAATAMNQRDTSRYDFENRWFRRAKGLEQGPNKELAQAAYDEGYAYARVTPRVEYFR